MTRRPAGLAFLSGDGFGVFEAPGGVGELLTVLSPSVERAPGLSGRFLTRHALRGLGLGRHARCGAPSRPVQAYYHPGLALAGVIIHHYEQAGTIQSRHWVGQLRASGLRVIDPAIPRRTWIGTARRRGPPTRPPDRLGRGGCSVVPTW